MEWIADIPAENILIFVAACALFPFAVIIGCIVAAPIIMAPVMMLVRAPTFTLVATGMMIYYFYTQNWFIG